MKTSVPSVPSVPFIENPQTLLRLQVQRYKKKKQNASFLPTIFFTPSKKITATSSGNHGNFLRKSRQLLQEITATSWGNHGNFCNFSTWVFHPLGQREKYWTSEGKLLNYWRKSTELLYLLWWKKNGFCFVLWTLIRIFAAFLNYY